jgi:hypothetical protein
LLSRIADSERRPAITAESFPWWIVGTAFRTEVREGPPAIAAELLTRGILAPAIRAQHRQILFWDFGAHPLMTPTLIFSGQTDQANQDFYGID